MLPLSVAKKLQQLARGNTLPASQFPGKWRAFFIEEGILSQQMIGRTKYRLVLNSKADLEQYLANQHHIKDLKQYIDTLEHKNLSGAEAQAIASDTKLRKASFSGFLIKSFHPIKAGLGDETITIDPPRGSFIFIADYHAFTIPPDITLVGIENPESFNNIRFSAQLFGDINPLLVCRYPQSQALINWLQQIPNPYLHFGDFDLAGVAIFEREFKRYLNERASFLIPNNIKSLIQVYGNRKLYEQQLDHYRNLTSDDPEVQQLIDTIHAVKKGLEQEYFDHD